MVSSVLTFDSGKSSSIDNKNSPKETNNTNLGTTANLNENNSNATSTENSSDVLNDEISILFPKCRPRNDVNLNVLTSNSSITGENFSGSSIIKKTITSTTTKTTSQSPPTSSLSSSSDSSINTTKSQQHTIGIKSTTPTTLNNQRLTNPFLNTCTIAQYDDKNILINNYNNSAIVLKSNAKMSSNIDGATKYSQKRSSHHGNGAKQAYYHHNQNPFIKDSERSIWELRTRQTPLQSQLLSPSTTTSTSTGNTVLNSPDLIEMETKLNFSQKSHPHHQIKLGRSPVNNQHLIVDPTQAHAAQSTSHQNKSLNIILDGEIVVFDDIGDSYNNKAKTDSSNLEKQTNFSGNYLTQTPDLYNCADTKKSNNDYGDLKNSSGIMEYDGSPRKFGQTQQIDISMYTTNIRTPQTTSTTLFPPRPGFPQRIINHNEPIPLQEQQEQLQQQHQLQQQTQHSLTSTLARESPPPPPPTEIQQNNLPSNIQSQCTDDTSNDISEICNSSEFTFSDTNKKSTFDYLYEFSETRKVLEEFFKCTTNDDDKTLEKFSDFNESDVDSIDIHYEFRDNQIDKDDMETSSYIGQRLAKSPELNFQDNNSNSPKENGFRAVIQNDLNDFDLFLDSASRSSGEINENEDIKNNGSRRHSRCFPYSPETTDYDSNCGDLDSEVSLRLIGSEFGLSGEFNNSSTYTTTCTKFYTSMPVLEDGLSSGHASDTENNNTQPISILMDNNIEIIEQENSMINEIDTFYKLESPLKRTPIITPVDDRPSSKEANDNLLQNNKISCKNIFKNTDPELESLYSIRKIDMVQLTPPPPAPAPHRKTSIGMEPSSPDIQAALKDIRTTLQRTKTLPPQLSVSSPNNEKKIFVQDNMKSPNSTSPIWVPRLRGNSDSLDSIENPLKNLSGDEDEADTDLETDRLLGHQRLDDIGFYDEKSWCDRDRTKPRSLLTTSISKLSPKIQTNNAPNKETSGNLMLRQGLNTILPTTPEISLSSSLKNANNLVDIRGPLSSPEHDDNTQNTVNSPQNLEESPNGSASSNNIGDSKKKTKSKEVLIEGVLFRARYLGSTQLVCEGQPTKSTRMIQAEEAVSRIKALSPDGETQPSTEVDLFISTEKIMVLNTDLKEIMMDHALRTISYIADIGDLVVLMARRRFVPSEMEDGAKPNRTPKMICHVFESEEAQFIAQSIGQAFQVAYMEFLKANGIEDHSFVKEMDYQEVLNSQEIFGDELEIFAKKELQKEVVVPKAKGEILGVVIVESGWGSMLPTVVIANLLSSGAAARCGQLNIGDQIIAINGLSLVGLPLSTCQNYIKNTKNQTVVKFTVVPCAPVVEVKIKRPNTKYQLGFSVQNGVICSLLRGGIAERGGVRVGHRIIEINNQSVVAVPHEKIVNLLATSVGEILMKTMPTSMFRLLTGQENPIYI